jgi:hypothetical protein
MKAGSGDPALHQPGRRDALGVHFKTCLVIANPAQPGVAIQLISRWIASAVAKPMADKSSLRSSQ